jgi:hypothetical protein
LAEAKKVPLAPLPGAVKSTLAPETGLPWVSVTRATSGLVKAVATVADWPAPEETAMVVAVPDVTVTALLAELVAVHELKTAVTV